MPFTQSSLSLPISVLNSSRGSGLAYYGPHSPQKSTHQWAQCWNLSKSCHTHPSRERSGGVRGSPDLGKVTQCQPEGIRNPRTNTSMSSQAWRQWAVKARDLRALTKADCQKPLASGHESDQCKEQCPVSGVLSPGCGRFLRRGDSSTHEVESPRHTGL